MTKTKTILGGHVEIIGSDEVSINAVAKRISASVTTPNKNAHTPMTPEQAMNNFKLFLELSPRNSYKDYRAAVREIAETCIALGIHDPAKDAVVAGLENLLNTRCFRNDLSEEHHAALDHARAAITKAKGK